MNIFAKIGSVIGNFLKSDLFKQIFKAGKEILVITLGSLGSELHAIAMKEVERLEQAPLGTDKYKVAYDNIRKQFPALAERKINLAIELALDAVAEKYLK